MGKAIRIYHSRPYKAAYVYIEGDKVTHASQALGFTIGWPAAKVAERANAVGFRMCTVMNMKTPNPTWLSKNTKNKKGGA